MEKIKTRKDHECCLCGAKIQKGEYAYYMEGRMAKYEQVDYAFERQIGITYYKAYYCFNELLINSPACI